MNERSTAPARPWRQAVRGNVLMMGLVSLFTDFSSEMMNPLLPIFLAGLPGVGVTLAAAYLAMQEGLAEATASLLKVFSGRLSDRLGKRKGIVVLGYGISLAARPVMALVMAGWQTVALKFFDRVGKGLRTSPRDALIGDSVPAEVRGLAFSFHRALDHAGAVVGPLAAIVVLYLCLGSHLWESGQQAPTPDEMTALRWLFAIALIPGVAAMLMLVLKVREIAPKPAPDGDKAPGAWRSLPRRFYAFVGVVTLFALGNSSDLFIPLLARERFGLGLLQVIVLWVALHVSKIAFSIPGGALSDKLGRRPVIVAGWIVYALVYLGLAAANHPWQFCALVVIYGFYYGMTEGAEKALVTDFSPRQCRGTAFGIYHGAVGVAALPGNLLFGLFWNRIGAAWAFGLGAALAGVAAALLVALLSSSGPRGRPERAQ